MSEKERESVKSITDALKVLPDSKKEFLIGYAEGVAAMAEKQRQEEHTGTPAAKRRRRSKKGELKEQS